MKEKFAKLIDVKSIMTLLLSLGFFILAMCGRITPEQYITIFTVIVGFYFGTQATKKSANTKDAAQKEEPTGTVVDAAENVTKTVEDSTVQAIHPPDEAVAE